MAHCSHICLNLRLQFLRLLLEFCRDINTILSTSGSFGSFAGGQNPERGVVMNKSILAVNLVWSNRKVPFACRYKPRYCGCQQYNQRNVLDRKRTLVAGCLKIALFLPLRQFSTNEIFNAIPFYRQIN